MDEANLSDSILISPQDSGGTPNMVIVTMRDNEPLDPVDAHALQELQYNSIIAYATIDDDGFTTTKQDDLGSSLPNIEKEDFHLNLKSGLVPLTIRQGF